MLSFYIENNESQLMGITKKEYLRVLTDIMGGSNPHQVSKPSLSLPSAHQQLHGLARLQQGNRFYTVLDDSPVVSAADAIVRLPYPSGRALGRSWCVKFEALRRTQNGQALNRKRRNGVFIHRSS